VDAEAETPQGESLVIPAGGRFDGLLAFSGAACIQGLLRGEVRARGSLRIGTSGRVEARLEVDELVVEGRLVGDVVARERVELRSTAVVEGTIHAPRVQLVDGCRFRGRCRSGVAGELPADTEDRVL
jgi:cytoskeletal protein CcmA (bactofilin family)